MRSSHEMHTVGKLIKPSMRREGFSMNIAFALPCGGRYPNGGFRVIYEYANRLTRQGHQVSLFHATDPNFRQASVTRKFLAILKMARARVTGLYLPKSWFALDREIKTKCTLMVHIPKPSQFDVIVATAWQTAPAIAKIKCSRTYYLIQGFENRSGEAPFIIETWTLPLNKIVISGWLKAKVEDLGLTCALLPNSVDSDFFYPINGFEDRASACVLVQLHPKPMKGSQDALAAIRILRERGKVINLILFGLANPEDFEIFGDYTFHRNPSQELLRQLYRQATIFVTASWSEGWGLTPHEACACGAAVIATDIGGHREFLEDEVSALLSPPQDTEALAANLARLLVDDNLRLSIARAGYESARRFTWKNAIPAFENILRKL